MSDELATVEIENWASHYGNLARHAEDADLKAEREMASIQLCRAAQYIRAARADAADAIERLGAGLARREEELVAARAEIEQLKALNLLLNKGVVDATAEIVRLNAEMDRSYVPTTGPLLDPDDYILTA